MGDRTEYTTEPVCPHCGVVNGDAWEWAAEGDGAAVVTACDECGQDFGCITHVSTHYSTEPVEPARSATPGGATHD